MCNTVDYYLLLSTFSMERLFQLSVEKERREKGIGKVGKLLSVLVWPYQYCGDDKGAVGEWVSDVHAIPLRELCDVQASWSTPLSHLQNMKIV